ncbi:hypothetical protein FQA47_002764 [Oryzias melastigma]|uniref:Uncharacterized protein n=1 Tax=Oryzias melastigma TaxID=30732 RepID=A0A834BUL8_ORYME|nr:hypothetical protein FQA47_002764 [Oryzias melastigma]
MHENNLIMLFSSSLALLPVLSEPTKQLQKRSSSDSQVVKHSNEGNVSSGVKLARQQERKFLKH